VTPENPKRLLCRPDGKGGFSATRVRDDGTTLVGLGEEEYVRADIAAAETAEAVRVAIEAKGNEPTRSPEEAMAHGLGAQDG
jgi:hypothetical protein